MSPSLLKENTIKTNIRGHAIINIFNIYMGVLGEPIVTVKWVRMKTFI